MHSLSSRDLTGTSSINYHGRAVSCKINLQVRLLVLSVVDAPGVGALTDHDPAKMRQSRLEPFPNPLGQALGGWIFQTLDVVEACMVQDFAQGVEGRGNIGEIDNPALFCLERTPDVDFNGERMAVHSGAFVAFRHIREPVRGRKSEGFVDDHGSCLRYAEYLMHLKAQPPLRMPKAVAHRPGRIGLYLRTVYGLEEKVPEVKGEILFRIDALLGVQELQLVSGPYSEKLRPPWG